MLRWPHPGRPLGVTMFVALLLALTALASAQHPEGRTADYFRVKGRRCGTATGLSFVDPFFDPSDCSFNFTNPADPYDPSVALYRIPVVVHVIQSTGGEGFLSEDRISGQIDVLNEDFLAFANTNGANGTDIQLEFHLATVDPDGNAATGITYSRNDEWFQDLGNYYDVLAWDPHRYLNIYTNLASDFLGYVSFFPQEGPVGSNADRIVVLHDSFGLNPEFEPYGLGRTATHEVGHYLGLLHTFHPNGECSSAAECYSTGDRICDTEPELDPVFGCPDRQQSCDSPDAYHNYMDYSDDDCMTNFTREQSRRLRCTLENYRPNLYEVGTSPVRNLACSSNREGIALVWTNNGAYDSIEVRRNEELLASLPGDATAFIDEVPAVGSNRYEVVARHGLPSAAARCTVMEGEQCVDAIAVGAGQTFFDTTGAASAAIWFSYEATCREAVTIGLCGSSYDTRLIIFEHSCPTGSNMIASNDDACGLQSQVTFPALAGSAYYILVSANMGATGRGELTISCEEPSGPRFVRGDANGDFVFNGLLDSLYILEFQFQNGAAPPCPEAADADGDGSFNGLVDSLYVLSHQFQGGPPPAAPFPECGDDPDPDSSLGCRADSRCV